MIDFLFESERLLFRKFTEEDVELIFSLNVDPEVTKYTHDPMVDKEQAEKVLNEVILPQYSLYGLGRWAVHLKSSREFIGWCGLKFIEELNEVDLGYRFIKTFWNKGYATEAALVTIKYGLEKLKIECITGRALPQNIASINVLKKCGMVFIGMQESRGSLTETFQLTNNNLTDKKTI